jgi:hypothetical protein
MLPLETGNKNVGLLGDFSFGISGPQFSFFG